MNPDKCFKCQNGTMSYDNWWKQYMTDSEEGRRECLACNKRAI